MKPLTKIRAERDSMSAIERRIADFILENAQLLRDYSSQQLAAALGISQSSVVKFSQKLGYRGYPDLKYSIAEAMTPEPGAAVPAAAEVPELMSGDLWRRKSEAESETRAINPPSALEYVASILGRANRVLLIGATEDSTTARAFAYRLALLGIASVHHFDYAHLGASIAGCRAGDVLLAISETGKQTALCQLARAMRERQGKVVAMTRHTSNPLRAHADIALLVSGHDDRPHVAPLLYQSGVQHLLDRLFVLLCEGRGDRLATLQANQERIRLLPEG
ncbi:Transcriptional regulator [Lysobacter dokdonensis DS-58]|uniref:Transcriptional regulator n=1 Tax=Lysobacter dokdonensis DS-58 TaxID=1300345 RepID=A0A0A2WL83_9GAMM|nr:MurR/RpiR family transcriptional regulator [Lysobacter dokdonensis]KGQ20553.1 Transcriptional regulator [Lysobacter dokdonensis DS-58]